VRRQLFIRKEMIMKENGIMEIITPKENENSGEI